MILQKKCGTEEKIEYIKLNYIKIDKVEENIPGLLHAKIGADIAVKKFHFSKEMADAIEAHSTGKENMDMLAKILYMADWTGEDRKYEDTEYLKKLTNENIDEAILYSLDKIIKEKIEEKEAVHIDTILTRNYFLIE